MKNLFYTFFVFAFFTCAHSCSSDDLNKDIPKDEIQSFDYNGIGYTSTFYYNSDSILIFDDEKVNEVYQRLMENPDLAVVITELGTTQFYDNFEAFENEQMNKLQKKTKNIWDPSNPTPTPTSPASFSITVSFYQNKGYTGTSLHFKEINNDMMIVYPWEKCTLCPNPVNLNDRTSSIVAKFISTGSTPLNWANCSVLTLFEAPDFKGRSITFKSYGFNTEIKINYLEDYVMKSGGLFGKKVTWKNEVSGAKAYYGIY